MSDVRLATTHEPLVIFSCKDPASVKQLLDNQSIPYERIVGCYKGKTENSFVVFPEAVMTVVQAGHLDDQECVLYLEKPFNVGCFTEHWRRHAWFMYLNLAPEYYVGLFQPVHIVAPNEDYTYAEKQYYVIRENVSRKHVRAFASRLAETIGKRISSAWRK